MSTMSTAPPTTDTERHSTLRSRLSAVPWLTVVPLAVVMAYADGFWMISLRGAAGSIERTGQPFESWLRESTLLLPVFVLAVIGALTAAARWFGPVLRRLRTVVATALLVVAAGTLVGIAGLTASSAYDYRLQSAQLQRSDASMRHAGGSVLAQQQQASFDLQVKAVGLGSAILLATNLVLVGWVVAFRGGRLDVSKTRARSSRSVPQLGSRGQGQDEAARHRGAAESSVSSLERAPAATEATTLATDSVPRSRADDIRLLLAAGLFGSAVIHAAVVPEHLTEWTAAGVFFIVLTAAELAVAALLLTRRQPTVLLAAAVASVGPLAVWLYSRTLGIPFGPEAGVPEQVGLADCAACVLEVITLLLAVVLLRGRGWLRRPPASAHVRGITVVAVIAVTAIGLAGSGLAWLDAFGSSGHHGSEDQSVTAPHSH